MTTTQYPELFEELVRADSRNFNAYKAYTRELGAYVHVTGILPLSAQLKAISPSESLRWVMYNRDMALYGEPRTVRVRHGGWNETSEPMVTELLMTSAYVLGYLLQLNAHHEASPVASYPSSAQIKRHTGFFENSILKQWKQDVPSLARWVESDLHLSLFPSLHIAYHHLGQEVQPLIEALLVKWGFKPTVLKKPVHAFTIESALHFGAAAVDTLVAAGHTLPAIAYLDKRHREVPSRLKKFSQTLIRCIIEKSLPYALIRMFENDSTITQMPRVQQLFTVNNLVDALNEAVYYYDVPITAPWLQLSVHNPASPVEAVYLERQANNRYALPSKRSKADDSVDEALKEVQTDNLPVERSDTTSLLTSPQLTAHVASIIEDQVVIRLQDPNQPDGQSVELHLDISAVPVEWLPPLASS